ANAAAEVVFSCASTDDDRPLSPSALIMAYPVRPLPALAENWVRMIAESSTLESISDDRAPRIAPGETAPGGSRIIQAQSDCPFQAMARHRLAAEPWPSPLSSLSPQERGWLVHATLAAFWAPLHGQDALLAL